VVDGQVEATTTVEVLQNFTHVRARRRSRRDGAELASAYADLLGRLLPLRLDDLQAGLPLPGT
jgi:hypothetical protein